MNSQVFIYTLWSIFAASVLGLLAWRFMDLCEDVKVIRRILEKEAQGE